MLLSNYLGRIFIFKEKSQDWSKRRIFVENDELSSVLYFQIEFIYSRFQG